MYKELWWKTTNKTNGTTDISLLTCTNWHRIPLLLLRQIQSKEHTHKRCYRWGSWVTISWYIVRITLFEIELEDFSMRFGVSSIFSAHLYSWRTLEIILFLRSTREHGRRHCVRSEFFLPDYEQVHHAPICM